MKIKILVIYILLICLTVSAVSAARVIWEPYHSSDEVNTLLKDLAAKYPDKMSYEVIGKSINGNNILMYKIGNPNGGKFMFDGRIHGPEDCGTENGIQFIKWVLESNEADAVRVRNNNYLLFIPIINIDDSVKRQNKRRSYTYTDGKTISIPYGVDLNRNFPTGWGNSGSTDPADNYDYMGPAAGSEPETQAVVNALKKYKPGIYMNVHCGMEMLQYREKTTTTTKVLSLITEISAKTGVNTNGYYSPSRGCGGGMACAEGATQTGGNGWIHETATWEHMPDTLAEYLRVWYPRAFPIYLAMAQAVEKNTTTNTTVAVCGDKVCNGKENCSTCATDCGTCPVPSTKITACTLPSKSWNEDTVLKNAYNLSACFTDPLKTWLTFTHTGDSKINVSIKGGMVTLSAPKDWNGAEKVTFKATSGDRSSTTNAVTLTVKPVADCGDGVCEGKENCTTCASDCGTCPSPSTKITACVLEDKSWDEDTVLENAYDLSACFTDPLKTKLTYTYKGNSKIKISINRSMVRLSAPADWNGAEQVTFYAYSGNRSATTNKVTLTVRPMPDCGDEVCEEGESCSSCEADCGTCKKSSGGGGGGGSSITYDWVCGDWSECLNGQQTQECEDSARDIKRTNKQECEMPEVVVMTPVVEPSVVTPIQIRGGSGGESYEVMSPSEETTSSASVLKGSGYDEQSGETEADANKEPTKQATGLAVKDARKPAFSIIVELIVIIIAGALVFAQYKKRKNNTLITANHVKQLDDYVTVASNRGFSHEQIRNSLTEVGWPEDIIEQVIADNTLAKGSA